MPRDSSDGRAPRVVVLVLLAVVLAAVALLTGCSAASPRSQAPVGANEAVWTNRGVGQHTITPIRLEYPTTGTADPTQNHGDLYLPDRPPARSGIPLLVLFHGGGWRHSQDGPAGMLPLARTLVGDGFAVFNVEYRQIGSGGGWPTTLTDARDAADFAQTLRTRYPALAGGPTVLIGHSAGGQLAVWASEHQPHPPQLVISIAGPLDMTYAALHGDHNVRLFLGGAPQQEAARYALADPSRSRCVRSPILMLQGTRDRVVPIGVARHYLEDVAGPGHPTMIEVAGATHTSLITPGRTGFLEVVTAIEQATEKLSSSAGSASGAGRATTVASCVNLNSAISQ